MLSTNIFTSNSQPTSRSVWLGVRICGVNPIKDTALRNKIKSTLKKPDESNSLTNGKIYAFQQILRVQRWSEVKEQMTESDDKKKQIEIGDLFIEVQQKEKKKKAKKKKAKKKKAKRKKKKGSSKEENDQDSSDEEEQDEDEEKSEDEEEEPTPDYWAYELGDFLLLKKPIKFTGARQGFVPLSKEQIVQIVANVGLSFVEKVQRFCTGTVDRLCFQGMREGVKSWELRSKLFKILDVEEQVCTYMIAQSMIPNMMHI